MTAVSDEPGPDQMRAFVVPEFGAIGAPSLRPKPTAAEGQVLVRVHAAGINAVDLWIIAGRAQSWGENRLPLIPGSDLSGVVEAVGAGVEAPLVGDEVFGPVAKRTYGEGTFAEYVTASAAAMHRKPGGLDHLTAAALPTAGAEGMALVDAVAPRPGETILVAGAGGGVGSFVTALAAQAGARVVAITRGDFFDHVRSLGAIELLDHHAGAEVVIAELGDRYPQGVDALIDTFSDRDGLNRMADVVRVGGRIASPRGAADVEGLAARGITGVNANAAFDRLDALAALVASGGVRVPVTAYPLDDAAAALADHASGRAPGKLVLVIG